MKKAPAAKKKAAKKPKTPEIVERILAPYHFTDGEKQALGSELAALHAKAENVTGEAKQISSQYKATLQGISARVSIVSNLITSGVEQRETQAVVTYDAKNGKKFYHNKSTGELIREEPMSQADYQLPMFQPEEVAGKKPSQEKPAVETGGGAPAPKEKKKKGKAEAPAGQTPIADVLDGAAGKTEPVKVPFNLAGYEGGASSQLLGDFKKAAKKAGWSAAQVSLIVDQLKECADVSAMIDTLKPHVATEGEAPAAQ